MLAKNPPRKVSRERFADFVGKLTILTEFGQTALKYAAALLAASLAIQMVFGAGLRSGSHAPRFGILGTLRDSLPRLHPSPRSASAAGRCLLFGAAGEGRIPKRREFGTADCTKTLRQLGTVRQQPLPENYTALDSMVLFPD